MYVYIYIYIYIYTYILYMCVCVYIYIYIYIYMCILPYVCSRDMLQLFGKGLIGFLWKYVSNSNRMHL